MADGAGANASGMILLPSALKPKMALWIWLIDGLGAVPCRNGQNCAPGTLDESYVRGAYDNISYSTHLTGALQTHSIGTGSCCHTVAVDT